MTQLSNQREINNVLDMDAKLPIPVRFRSDVLRVGDAVDQVAERADGGSATTNFKSKRENPAICEYTFSLLLFFTSKGTDQRHNRGNWDR